jgi:hypothetical protein
MYINVYAVKYTPKGSPHVYVYIVLSKLLNPSHNEQISPPSPYLGQGYLQRPTLREALCQFLMQRTQRPCARPVPPTTALLLPMAKLTLKSLLLPAVPLQ